MANCGSHPLCRISKDLRALSRFKSRLAPLVFMTDPARMADPIRAVTRLPECGINGLTVIYRHFGRGCPETIADQLRQITFSRGYQLLIGNDPALALKCGADGVHFRRNTDFSIARTWRRRCPEWSLSIAGMKDDSYMQDKAYISGLKIFDAVFISSVFASQSPSAGPPIGIKVFSDLCHTWPVPVFALGGVTAQTAPRLRGSGTAGLATISGLLQKTT